MKTVVCLYGADVYNGQISTHFKTKEFACKSGCKFMFYDPALFKILEEVREHFGKPVVINSGYRDEAYNQKIGGARLSMHCAGIAADIVVKGVDAAEVYKFIDERHPYNLGLGKYKAFTHVDTRKYKSRWNG